MINRIVAILFVLFSVVTPVTASAQEIIFGLGATKFDDQGSDSAVFDLEYRHTPFFQRRILSASFAANASLSGEGDVFVGAGLAARWKWQSGWFIDSSVIPGLFEEGTSGNDLGSTFQIRTLLGVGYEFDSGRAISFAASHKSNAGLDDQNPGAEVYAIRYHIGF